MSRFNQMAWFLFLSGVGFLAIISRINGAVFSDLSRFIGYGIDNDRLVGLIRAPMPFSFSVAPPMERIEIIFQETVASPVGFARMRRGAFMHFLLPLFLFCVSSVRLKFF